MTKFVVHAARGHDLVPNAVTGDVLVAPTYRYLPLVVSHSIVGIGTAIVSSDDPATVRALNELQRYGQIVGYRQMFDDYRPLGVIDIRPYLPLAALGSHLPVCGITMRWQNWIGRGAGLRIGLADTGTPPMAAVRAMKIDLRSLGGGVDQHGHATACASLLAGERGVLPEAEVLCAAALPGGRGTEETVAQAFEALARAGVSVISASLGGSRSSHINNVVEWCQRQGVSVSCAAGNGGPSDIVGSPAYTAQFVWGATTLDGSRSADFSSGGNDWPSQDGAFPGVDVPVMHLDGGVGTGTGTSFACPLGSAIVAALARPRVMHD